MSIGATRMQKLASAIFSQVDDLRKAEIAKGEAALEAIKDTYPDLYQQQKAELDAKKQVLNQSQDRIDAGKAQLDAQQQILNASQAQIDDGRSALSAGSRELGKGWTDYETALKEVEDADVERRNGLYLLQVAQEELDEGR